MSREGDSDEQPYTYTEQTYTQTEGANLQREIVPFDHPYHPWIKI